MPATLFAQGTWKAMALLTLLKLEQELEEDIGIEKKRQMTTWVRLVTGPLDVIKAVEFVEC